MDTEATTLEQQIIEAVRNLSAEDRRKVLSFVKAVNRPKGTPGKLTVEYARELDFAPEDLEAMERAIEEACGLPSNH